MLFYLFTLAFTARRGPEGVFASDTGFFVRAGRTFFKVWAFDTIVVTVVVIGRLAFALI